MVDESAPSGVLERLRSARRTDLIFTLIMSVAAVGTAWAGFQSAAWNNLQTHTYAEASQLQLEAGRKASEANSLRAIDVVSFAEWISAVNAEAIAGTAARPEDGWRPVPGAAATFVYERFRYEFRSAFDAWLALEPLTSSNAPPTPFTMAEYRLASQEEADSLAVEAEHHEADAQEAGAVAGNYVLSGVLLALVIFFAALGNKMDAGASRDIMLGLSGVTLLASIVVLATYPVRF